MSDRKPCSSRGAHRTAILAMAFAALSMGVVERAAAQEVPPGCTFAGAGASMTRFPPTNVQHGQEICYQIQYSNGAAGINCEIRNFDADLFFPNGTSLPMMAGATIASGEVVTCPNPLEPRCLALSNCTIPGRTGYRYIVAHADEVFDFNGCPPVDVPGIGKIVAYTEGNGDSLTNPPDFAAACATANNNVPHGACCDKCIPSCTDNVTENECTAPGAVFIPGGTCALDCVPLNCNDFNDCTTDCCIPAVPGIPAHCTNTSECIDNSCAPGNTPQTCNDNNACTGPDVCDASNPPSCCSFPPITCPTPPACFTQGPCHPVTGCPAPVSDCVTNPNLCDDNNECTRDICDVTAPGCCRYEDIPCPPPPVCFTRGPCNPKTGCPTPVSDCVTNPDLCDDDNVCTRDICDVSAPGCCRYEDIPCPPPPVCFTRGPCHPVTGCQPPISVCDDPSFSCPAGSICNTDAPDCCEVVQQETCRTPGFWGTHACGANGVNCEKDRSRNVTLAALNACGGCVDICGDIIDTTVLNDSDSALEAICVSPQGTQVRQLARQLTAAALNCCISGSTASCGDISVEPFFTACNAACAAGNVTALVNKQRVDCIRTIDDFNNGRISDCHERNVGLCSNGAICTEQVPCVTGNCGPHGPAGSSNACNAAGGNRCYVIGTTDCAGTDDSNASQSCPD